MRGKNKGFSLIETVLVILVLGIALTPLCVMIVNVVQKNALSQIQATAVALAEAQMENVTGSRFSSIANMTGASFPGIFSGYSYSFVVDTVNATNPDSTVSADANYKKVQIRVYNSATGNLTLVTLVANDW